MKALEKRPGGTALFWLGLFVGVALAGLFVTGACYYLTDRGLVVTLEIEELADYLGDQIEAQAAQELPRVLEEVKARVPALVKKQMQGGNRKAEIKISDISIILPPSALAELDNYLQGTVETTLYRLLDGMELDTLARDLGQQARELVTLSLGKELAARQVLSIKTWWGRIPVLLEVGKEGQLVKDQGNYVNIQ